VAGSDLGGGERPPAPGATGDSPLSGLEIRVLGPVEIAVGGRPVDVGGVKARALMARLLIDRGVVVSVDRLVDSLWADHDAGGGEIALRSTISRLRKRLREAGAEDPIVTRAPGYLLELPAEATDVFRFEQLVADGRNQLSRRRPREATRVLWEAQMLWRGPAYSEVCDEPFARAEARRLEELLLSAIELRIDAGMTMGHHHALISELETLTSAHPMRERLWSQRMLALYRSGRQAEALRVFQDLRTLLVDELGIEPGTDVTWLEHAILSQDAVLDFAPMPEQGDTPAPSGPEAGAPAATTSSYRVRLPTAGNDGPLVGREQESARLREWWEADAPGDAQLLLVDGDPGIGKTRLVADLARAVEAEGVLVLWGHCDEEPVAPFQPFAEALGRYFQSLSADQISHMPEWQLAELSRLVVRLREYVPLQVEEVADPESERFRFFEAVSASLNELSDRSFLLLVLDDLHWADEPTLLLLRHVLRGVDATKFGIVGMFIDTEVPADHRLRGLQADLRADHAVDTVHLEGLQQPAVEELVRAAGLAPGALAAQLFSLTDGNPLFVDEMVRQLRDHDAAAADDALVPPDLNPPEAIRELVGRRVSRQPEDVIYLLQAAAVAGPTFEAGIVGVAAELTPDQRLEALDRAEESRLLRRVGDTGDRFAFTHALVRGAIYGELLRGRRVRYHHKIAVATEKAHADAVDSYVNELAHHFSMGAALADAEKAVTYCTAAGERALRLLAFEEAVGHFARGLEVAEQYGEHDASVRCDLLIALAEAQNRAGDAVRANANFERAAALARTMGDAERLAAAALRAGPLSYLGIVDTSPDQMKMLEEALSALPDEDSHLRAMVMARLGLFAAYSSGQPAAGARERARELNTAAVAMARRLDDRNALGYALNARMHALWGVDPAPERMAAGRELGEIADDVGDELLALHGHMWRIRELLVQGDVDAVHEEVARFEARDAGPVHPLSASYSCNVAAMLALIEGDFARADELGPRAMEKAEGYNDMVLSFHVALMLWTWWQRDELSVLGNTFRDAIAEAPTEYPVVRAATALIRAESGEPDAALTQLEDLSRLGWETIADDQTEGVSLAITAAACGTIGYRAREHAEQLYEHMRPYAGTAVVIRAPAAACMGPADHYLGLLAAATGDLALAEVHYEAALRMARRMHSEPFATAAMVELARTLRQRGRHGDDERVAVLLRTAEEAALRLGLARLVRLAADPGPA
jgi:DNA-binding SARP family transcriptional activator/tetratricopeptide (TPR) repeat protein